MIRRLVLLAIAGAVAAPVVDVHAAEPRRTVVVLRYTGANGAGWTDANGGLGVGLVVHAPAAAIPDWATAVHVAVVDDEGRPVHGVATTSWRGHPIGRAVVCSGVSSRMDAVDPEAVGVRISAGLTTGGGECPPGVSAPTSGRVILTFTG